jgi:HlyD family secretion protein
VGASRRIEPNAFTKVSPLGLEEQRVVVVLDFATRPSAAFGNDYRVNVAVEVWKSESVLAVPSTALFCSRSDWAVFVVRDGRAKLIPVTLGRADESRTAIERGLSEGDVVINQPADTISDHTAVTPMGAAK